MRKVALVTGEYYHVYNRGTDKRAIFLNDYDYKRFLQSLEEFNTLQPIGSIYENSFLKSNHEFGNRMSKSPLVNILCYCLNRNHIHLILKQMANGGISEFMKRVSGGYTKYFNNKYKRTGVLFQGKFKANHIDTNEYLLHASVYVNLNDQLHTQENNFNSTSSKTSWKHYIEESYPDTLPACSTEMILNQFSTKKEYESFAVATLQNIREKKQMSKELEQLLTEDI